MDTIYEASVYPSGMDYPEETRTLGYFSTREEAETAAYIWIQCSRPPHGGNPCGCRWESVIVSITIGKVSPLFR